MNHQFPLAVCWAFPGDSPETGLPRIREAGFEGVELWPDALRAFGAMRWKTALEANELKCFQLCPYFNFVEGEEKLEESRAQLREFLGAARVLDCGRIRVFTGPPWGEGVVGGREASPEQWQTSILGLREFCADAAKQNVELCLECHEGSLMEDSPQTLRLLEGVGAANLTVNLQLPLRDEAWKTSVETLAPFTSHIHIHNWEAGLHVGPMTFLDAGAFDWRPVLEQLSQTGRRICLSIEHIDHAGRHDPWETVRRDGVFLSALREQIQPRLL